MDTQSIPNFDPLNVTQLAEALIEENEDIARRAKEILATADDWDKIENIETEEDAADLTDFLDQMGSCWDTADDRRDKGKRVYDAPAKVVQKFFKDLVLDTVGPRRDKLKAKLKIYLDAVKAEKEIILKAQLADMNKRLAEAQTPAEVKAVTKEIKGAVAAAKKVGIKTDFGSKAHQTTRWAYEITDIEKVPKQFIVVDQAAVMAFIGTGTEANPVEIPGILVKRVTGIAA